MNTVIIVFLVLMIVVTGLTAGIVISELVNSRKAPNNTAETETPPPTLAASETVATRVITAPATPAPTHEEKYSALPDDARSWYDEISAYAAAIDGIKHTVKNRYEEYAIGSRKVVRLTIKRGVTVCEFILRNSDLFQYASEKKIVISTAPTAMKITDESLVAAAKNTIDLVVQNIGEEKAIKRQIANEHRKQRRTQTENRPEEGGEE